MARLSNAPVARTGLFDEDFQRRLEVLAIVARRIRSGQQRAERRSKKLGSGIEFADYRPYAAGDDFRYLDWNVYQRLGKLLTRLFEEEEDLLVHILIDASRSMAFGEPSKLDYAKQVAAALAHITLSTLDRVQLTVLQSEKRQELPATRGRQQILRIFDFLGDIEGSGKTDLASQIKTFCARNRRRGVAIVISDFYDPNGFETALQTLRYNRFDTYALQLVDPHEFDQRLLGDVQVVDAETGEAREVTLTPGLKKKLLTAKAAFDDSLEVFCANKQITQFALRTDVPFDESVLTMLRRGGLVR